LLKALDGLGHGDVLAIVDANFPAQRLGKQVLSLPGIRLPEALDAVVTVFPVEGNPQFMAPEAGSAPVHTEMAAVLATQIPPVAPPQQLGRYEFYAAVANAETVIQTGETRPYGNVLLSKAAISTSK
jgi:L-fucose mutarotase